MEQPTEYNAPIGNVDGASPEIREALKGFRTLQNLIHESEEAPECVYLVTVPGRNGTNDAFWNAYVDERKAIGIAQCLGGVIATLPITHDFRR